MEHLADAASLRQRTRFHNARPSAGSAVMASATTSTSSTIQMLAAAERLEGAQLPGVLEGEVLLPAGDQRRRGQPEVDRPQRLPRR